MALDIATDPDTLGLLPRLGLTDEHPLGWLLMGCARASWLMPSDAGSRMALTAAFEKRAA